MNQENRLVASPGKGGEVAGPPPLVMVLLYVGPGWHHRMNLFVCEIC